MSLLGISLKIILYWNKCVIIYDIYEQLKCIFIVLKGNHTLKDLAVICGVRDYAWITKPPPQCTAMGLWPIHMGNIKFFKFIFISTTYYTSISNQLLLIWLHSINLWTIFILNKFCRYIFVPIHICKNVYDCLLSNIYIFYCRSRIRSLLNFLL